MISIVVINKYLLQDLIDLGIWNDEMKDTIVYFEGSIQNIKTILMYKMCKFIGHFCKKICRTFL